MLIIPYWTDIADRVPWGTVGIIGANLAVALLLGFPHEVVGSPWGPPPEQPLVNSFILEFGTFNPLQWLTSAFTHGTWDHLIFNMIFLWIFGLIVEAHLSLGRFLLLYVAIALGASAVTQILMLGSDGGAIGASAAIFGLMVISALWAPRNHVEVFFWFFIIVKRFEVTVLALCGFYLGLNLLQALLLGFAMSTPVLHLIGAGAGLAAGLWMLKNDHVDCGGMDWFSQRERRPVLVSASEDEPEEEEDPAVAKLVKIRDALDEGNALGADIVYAADPDSEMPPEDLRRLIDGLSEAGATARAALRMEQFLEIAPRDGEMRLRLATILIKDRRKANAREQLALIDDAQLDDEQRALKRELEERSRTADGGLELE